jgi:hypothetical protein
MSCAGGVSALVALTACRRSVSYPARRAGSHFNGDRELAALRPRLLQGRSAISIARLLVHAVGGQKR